MNIEPERSVTGHGYRVSSLSARKLFASMERAVESSMQILSAAPKWVGDGQKTFKITITIEEV